jgi:hypothetical protein
MVLGVTCMGKDCIRHVMEKGSLPYENIQDLKYAAKQHVKELAVSRIQKENGYEVLNQFLRTMSYMQTKCKSGV